MNLFLGTFRKQEFVDWLISKIDEAEKENATQKRFELDYQKKKEIVEKNIQIYGYMVTVGMINRITSAIFSDKLTFETTYLAEKKNTPAYKLIDFLLNQMHSGIDINKLESVYSEFEKTKNYWASWTLSYYVQSYLHTHKLSFKNRQKAFNILGIQKYVPNRN